MKKTLYVCMNHVLTDEQIEALKILMRGEIVIVQASEQVKRMFSNIPADWEAYQLRKLAKEICSEIEKANVDLVFITGHAWIVAFVYEQITRHYPLPYVPWMIDSVSERVSVDIPQPDGTIKKVSEFKFVRWRLMT